MKQFCGKHRNLMGCLVAGITFIALHLVVPALVAGTVAHQATAEEHCDSYFPGSCVVKEANPTLVKIGEFDTDELEKGKLSLFTFEVMNRRMAAPQTCVIGLLPGRFTTMYQMECL